MANQCKYYKQVLQVSYDSGVTWVNIGETRKGDLYEYNSPACGAVTEYRWVDVTGQYTCDGTTKYQKTKRQYSEDGGQTWSDVSPAEYGKGDVIEYQSSDCGYVPPAPASGNYLTFVAIDDGRFKFSSDIHYSLDEGSTWSTLASNTYSPTVYTGQKIMWKCNLTPYAYVGTFSSTGSFNVEGNVMSLMYGDNFDNNTSLSGKSYAFAWLFSGCTKLQSAENLVLPATTLTEHCYSWMFANCKSLTAAPALPATTLADSCYVSMFWDCTSLRTFSSILPATTLAPSCYVNMFAECSTLTTVPNNMLPATTLVERCYLQMFWKCTSLTNAPELPATTLADSCYELMFIATNLNYIKCLATDISAPDCTYHWLANVSSSGTFVKASSMNSWTTGVNGIPTNWTIQNA